MTKKEIIDILVTKYGKEAKALNNLKVAELEEELKKAEELEKIKETQDADPGLKGETGPEQDEVKTQEASAENSEQTNIEEAINKNPPKDEKPTKGKSVELNSKPSSAGDKVKVLGVANIITLDGDHIKNGEIASISQKEYDRLKKDVRGPFFKDV